MYGKVIKWLTVMARISAQAVINFTKLLPHALIRDWFLFEMRRLLFWTS